MRIKLAMGLVLIGFVQGVIASPISFYTNQDAFKREVPVVLVEDFEDFASNRLLETYTQNGISYTAHAGIPHWNIVSARPGFSNFGSGVQQPTTTSILAANGDEDFTARFLTPVKAVGFDTYYNGLGPARVRVYGKSGLLDTFSRNANNKGYLGIVSSSEPITSIRFTSTKGGVLNTGIDNISISTIPEAKSVMMMGMAGALALFVRRVFLS